MKFEVGGLRVTGHKARPTHLRIYASTRLPRATSDGRRCGSSQFPVPSSRDMRHGRRLGAAATGPTGGAEVWEGLGRGSRHACSCGPSQPPATRWRPNSYYINGVLACGFLPVRAWPPGPASGLGQALRGQMVREWSVRQSCREGAAARLGLGRQYLQWGLIGLSGWPHGRKGAEWPVAGHSEVVLSLVK